MQKIFSNVESLSSQYKEISRLGEIEKIILRKYFEHGGLIKTNHDSSLKIIYPSNLKIKKELEEARRELESVNKNVSVWENTKSEAEEYINNTKKSRFVDSTYWKHIYKTYTDKDYKKDFDKIRIPQDMISDPKLKKIVQQFMKDPDYRKKLVETMESSIVYKNKAIGDQILDSVNIKKDVANKKLVAFYKARQYYEDQIKAYKLVSRWVVE